MQCCTCLWLLSSAQQTEVSLGRCSKCIHCMTSSLLLYFLWKRQYSFNQIDKIWYFTPHDNILHLQICFLEPIE